MNLNLETANRLIEKSFAQAEELSLKPIAVCILDDGGVVRAYQAQDGSASGRFDIASGKARGALATGAGTRWLNDQAQSRPHFVTGLASVVERGIIPVPGGVIARSKDGNIIAVIGISGDTSDNDEACAVSAIQACGLIADTGA